VTTKQRPQRRAQRIRAEMRTGATGGIGYGARVGQTIRGALGRGAGGLFIRAAERETLRERNERLRALLAQIRAYLRTPAGQAAGKRTASRRSSERRQTAAQRRAKNRRDTVERIVARGWMELAQANAFLAFIEDQATEEQISALEALGLLDEDGNLARAGRLLKTAYDTEKLDMAKRALEMAKESVLEKSMLEFGRSVRAAARAIWRGEEGAYYFFVETLDAAVERGYERAWREGARMCGILPQDRTPEEQAELARYISIARSRIIPLADYVQEHSRANGHLWRELQPRLDIWIQRYNEVREVAKGMSCADSKAIWIYGDTIEHCDDCSHVVGKVYRLSVWDKYGWVPGSRALACGGWRCDCKREPTTRPVTPGRPPSLKGA
jgi:hypothetical protein